MVFAEARNGNSRAQRAAVDVFKGSAALQGDWHGWRDAGRTRLLAAREVSGGTPRRRGHSLAAALLRFVQKGLIVEGANPDVAESHGIAVIL